MRRQLYFAIVLTFFGCLNLLAGHCNAFQSLDHSAETLIEEFRLLTRTHSAAKEAWEKAKEIESLGREILDDDLRVRGLCRMAFMDARFNFDGKWKDQLELGGTLCSSEKSLAYAELLAYRGIIKTDKRNLDEGAADIARAIQISIESSYDQLAAIAFNYQALNSIQRLQLSRAIEEAFRGRVIAEQTKDDHAFRANTITLIRAFSITNQADMSEKYAKELLDRNLRAYAADWVLVKSDNFELVEAVRQRIEEIPDDVANSFDAGIKAAGNAKLSLRDGHYDEAMGYYDDAVKYFGESDSPIIAYMVEYERQLAQLKYAAPEMLPKKLEAILEDNHGRESDVFTAEKLMEAFEKTGDLESALKWAKRSLDSRKVLTKREVEDAERRANDYWVNEQNTRQQLETIRKQQIASARNLTVYSTVCSIGFVILGVVLLRFNMMRRNRYTLSRLVDEKTQSLSEARQRAESADQAKSEFLARINHELRNPLAAILGYCELLEREPLDNQKCADYVRGVQASSMHLTELVGEVLELSEIEEGHVKTRDQNFSLETVCEHVSRILAEKADEKQLDFSCRLEPVCEPMVFGDEKALRQILINLCNNSIKFTDSGCVHAKITSASLDDHIQVVLSVSDTGIGISEDELEHVFSPFYQSGEMGNSPHGIGLGLYIVKRLTDHLGATIHVESEVSVGTCIQIKIPYGFARQDENVAAQVNKESTAGVNPTFKVLVIDDQESIGDVVCGQINVLGLESEFTPVPDKALKLIHDWLPDLVLLDLRMPGLDGFEVLGMIRAKDGGDRLPVVAMTGDATQDVIDRITEAGFDGYMTKPFRIEKLQSTIRKFQTVGAQAEQ